MGLFKMPAPNQLDALPLVKTKLGGVIRIPISSKFAVSFIKRRPMDPPVLPMRIVGALVTLDAKLMEIGIRPTIRAPPGILFWIDSMSIGLFVLENKGERLKNWLLGVLQRKYADPLFPLAKGLECGSFGCFGCYCCNLRCHCLKNPDRLVGVVLAGIDVDMQMRLRRRRKPSQCNPGKAESCPFFPSPLNPHLFEITSPTSIRLSTIGSDFFAVRLMRLMLYRTGFGFPFLESPRAVAPRFRVSGD